MPAPIQIATTQSSAAAAVTILAGDMSGSRARDFLVRLVRPIVMLLTVLVGGTIGYMFIGGGSFSLLDCFYMSSITLTTVGYGEVIEIQHHPHRDMLVSFTILLMWVGMGVTLYAITTVTAFIVENNLGYLLKGRRMLKEIDRLEGHTIICGLGGTGSHAASEFLHTKEPCVLVERDSAVVEHWKETHPDVAGNFLYLIGDATDEFVLNRAGIHRARGLIAALATDAENLLVVVSSKYINKDLRVISKVIDIKLSDKIRKAGADGIVSPSFIGGMRLASEMIRPNVVNFLDHMLRSKAGGIRVAEVTIEAGSELEGKQLRAANILEHTGMLVIAIRRSDDEDFIYNPGPVQQLLAGYVVVVIGGPQAIVALKKMSEA